MSKKLIRRKQKGTEKKIAKEQINELFTFAKKEFKTDKNSAKNAIKIMRDIGTRFQITLPKEIKHSFCKKCNTLFIPDISATYRIKAGKKPLRIITCKNCKTIKRIGFEK